MHALTPNSLTRSPTNCSQISLLIPQPNFETGCVVSNKEHLGSRLEPRSDDLKVYEEYGPCPTSCPHHGELQRGRIVEWVEVEGEEHPQPRLVLGVVPNSCPVHSNDPPKFVRHVLGVRVLLLYQRTLLLTVRDNKATAMASCHGAGKSYTDAIVVLWFLSTRKPAKAFTTAPSGPQIIELWTEIRQLHANAPQKLPGVVMTKEIKATKNTSGKDANWKAAGRAARDGNSAQGWHSPNLLVLYDEATGVKDAIRTSLLGALGDENSREVATGNPTGEGGFFREAWGKAKKFWRRLNVSALATTNVRHRRRIIPGLVGHEYVDRIRELFGENSPYWICRILGRFFNFGEERTIPPSWVKLAQERYPTLEDGFPRRLLVDPACSLNNDSTGVVVQAGLRLRALTKYQEPDTMANARRILRFAIEELCTEIRIDITGPTKGIGDKLVELEQMGLCKLADGTPVKITCIVWSNSATEPEFFDRQMDEMWWRCHDAFRPGTPEHPNANAVGLCPDGQLADELASQLSCRGYKMDRFGKIKVESKPELAKRGVSSPDLADAAVMGYYQDQGVSWFSA